MSNDNKYERLWKLQTKANVLVLDGKRDINVLLSFYQRFMEAASFNPATFIGEGWSYDEARDLRSAALGPIDDYSQVKLSTDWLRGAHTVDGEKRRKRILADRSSVALNCDHFLDLWNNKEKIPESWKKVGVITFDGDVLHDPDEGDRSVLCLFLNARQWHWNTPGLRHIYGDNDLSAVLAR